MGSQNIIGLLFEINADPSQANSAVEAFAQHTGQSVGLVEAKVRDYSASMRSAYDEDIQRSRLAGEEVDKTLLNNRESTRLLAEEFGVRLPRAVTGAISRMLPDIAGLGSAMLGIFAVEEVVKFVGVLRKAGDEFTGIAVSENYMKEAGEENLRIMEETAKSSKAYARIQSSLLIAEATQQDQFVESLRQRAEKEAMYAGYLGVIYAKIIGDTKELTEAEQQQQRLWKERDAMVKILGLDEDRERKEATKAAEKQAAAIARARQEAERTAQEIARETLRLQSQAAAEIAHLSLELNTEYTPELVAFYGRLQHINDEFGKTPLAISIADLELQKFSRDLAASQAEWGKEQAGGLAQIFSADQSDRESRGMAILQQRVDGLVKSAKQAGKEFVDMHTKLRLLHPDFAQLHPDIQAIAFSFHNLSNIAQHDAMQMAEGMTKAGMSAAIYGHSVKQAMAEAAKATIASIAEQAAVYSVYALAEGLYFLAKALFFGDPKAMAAATADFTAAAEFGAVAGVAGAAAASISTGGGSSSSGGSGSGSGSRSGSGSGSGSRSGSGSGSSGGGMQLPGMGPSSQKASPTITLNVYGHVIGTSGSAELISMLNLAQQSGQGEIRVNASQVIKRS